MHKVSRLAVLIGAVLSTNVCAQTVEGTIVDRDGKAISNVNVKVEGSSLSTKTDKNGRFVINNLTVGKSELHISAAGFSHIQKDILLADNETKQLSLALSQSPIEVIDVVSTPIHMSVMESASPVSVLGGDTLRRNQAATLGDTLEKVVGVHSNFHANVASTPIIRGLSGPRVMIAQNGLDVSDVSRVGPDHAVASEASTSTQIEVLRGPATLFYGSGAIGGLVNVVDGRVPTNNETRSEWLLESGSVDDQKLASFNMTTGAESFGFYVDGFWRESNDYQVPVSPELEHSDHEHDLDHSEETHDFVVANSSEESNGLTLGASYLFDNGYFGVAVEKFNREYGIPGHSHGGEDAAVEDVYADLEQTRVQLLGEFNVNGSFISKVNLRGGFTEYEHAEIERNVTGTLFENETSEFKADVLHSEYDGWHGGVSFHYKNSKVAAQGEEAFTPPSESQTFAVAVMEEKHFGNLLVQLGGRIEHVSLDAANVLLPQLAAHQHEEEEHDDEHDHDEHGHDDHDDHGHDDHNSENVTRVFGVEQEFTPVSLSAGVVWSFDDAYNVGLSVSRSERAPSASELLSFGSHIGTRSYEIGALFALHDDADEMHIGLSEKVIDLETANNIDLTFRKTQGEVGFVFNAFYNQVDNYYYQSATGLFAESSHAGHDHGDQGHDDHGHDEHDDHAEDVHIDELPVYLFQTDDVILHGFEAQIAWQVSSEFKASFFSDYVRARLKEGEALPRTPPLRFGTQLNYELDQFSFHLDLTRYHKQDKLASFETATDGYTLVDASVSYHMSVLDQDVTLFLEGKNLTDTEARVHSSFLKDIAPRPGRNIAAGIRGNF